MAAENLPVWIFLIFVMFVLDLFTPVYPLCTWVSLFFINEFLLLIKKLYIYIYICICNVNKLSLSLSLLYACTVNIVVGEECLRRHIYRYCSHS